MDFRNNLESARNIIIKKYSSFISEIILDKDRPVLKVVFINEVNLYIRYNDYGEYSYSAIFSPVPDDQMRFDNYDNIWRVKSRPHHFHKRGMQSVVESPMIGEPNHDISILLKNILADLKK